MNFSPFVRRSRCAPNVPCARGKGKLNRTGVGVNRCGLWSEYFTLMTAPTHRLLGLLLAASLAAIMAALLRADHALSIFRVRLRITFSQIVLYNGARLMLHNLGEES